ncbi:MAG: ComEC/Rec2 family competence protein [Cetobacterium sp.]
MKKIKISTIVIIFITIFIFRLNWVSFKGGVEVGDIVQIVGRVDAGNGRIESINGKYPSQYIYFIVDKVEDGNVNILGTINKINYSKWGTNYKINVEEIKNVDSFFKEFLIKKLKRMTKEYSIDLLNFLRGTLLGEGYLIDDHLKESFRYTGTAHILVISGLHIGVIISGVSYALMKFKIPKKERCMLVLIILTLYVFSIGKTPSVFRAYIMAVIYLLGNILYEKVNTKKSLIVAFVISLLIYPTWIYTISFWMSYTAVFSIVFIYDKIPKIKRFKKQYINNFINTISLTLVIQICMTPIFYIYFSNIPFLSFFSNLIVIPIASAFIIISFLTMLLSNLYLEFLTMPLLNISYIFLIEVVQLLSEIPYLTLEL